MFISNFSESKSESYSLRNMSSKHQSAVITSNFINNIRRESFSSHLTWTPFRIEITEWGKNTEVKKNHMAIYLC